MKLSSPPKFGQLLHGKGQLPFTLMLRIVGAFGSAFLTFLIAKLGDAALLGAFQYGLTVALGLSIIARYGLDRIIVRYIAGGYKSGNFQALGLIYPCLSRILKVSVIIIIIMAIFAPFINERINMPSSNVILVLAFPFIGTCFMFSGFYKGSFKPTVSFMYEAGCVSIISCGYILALHFLKVRMELAAPVSVTAGYATMAGIGIVKNRVYLVAGRANKDKSQYKKMKGQASSFFLMTFSVYVQQLVVVVTISEVMGNYQLGLYKVAEKISVITAFCQTVVNAIYAPHFAHQYKNGNIYELKKEVHKACAMSFLLAAPLFLAVVLFSKYILQYFGSEYLEAHPILMLLTLAQLFNVVTGPAALLLNMTGNEKITKNIILTCSLFSVPIIGIGAYHLGAIGAAMAVFLVVIAQNGFSYWFCYKRLGILIYPKISI